MSDIDLLRRAAALMRERAQAATSGAWQARPALVTGWGPADPPFVGARSVAVIESWSLRNDDAEHIAAWHPAVALAVADWLDEHARLTGKGDYPFPPDISAVRLARAYLGEDA